MACNHPMIAFKTGLKTETGKDELIIMKDHMPFCSVEYAEKKLKHRIPNLGFNMYPIENVMFLRESVQIPCGKCIGCRLEYSRQWAIRCCLESTLYEDNQFITLTYNDSNLPKDMRVSKRDFQLFMKRLRKRYGEGVRFFACGEYGTLGRPHYHAILFNLKITDKRPVSYQNGCQYYESAELNKIWKKGFISIGDVTFNSCAYVARYVMKKTKDTSEDFKPFLLMSRKPGIAAAYFMDHQDEIYKTDKIYEKIDDRPIQRPPHYFDYLFDKSNPDKLKEVKDFRKTMAINIQTSKFWRSDYESLDEMLEAAEQVTKRKLKRLVRPLL